MDFLDPRSRRKHRARLMVGYGLIALAIGLATVLVYDTLGYGINTKTGDIIANGLLFVDSKPGDAVVYLNGKDQNAATSSRLILPAKDYKLTLKKPGYRDWSRAFTLSEHSIARYVYPLLIPSQPKAQTVKSYPAPPGLITQSPDRRKLLVQSAKIAPGGFTFDEYETADPKQAPKSLALPPNLLTGVDKAGTSLAEVEWSTDNRHLLLRHDYAGGSEFLIFDRESPDKSINLNRLFGAAPTSVVLRNKKSDQVYIYSASGGVLQVGDTTNGLVDQPILREVIAFKPYGTNLLTYITATGAPEGQVSARIWESGKTYQLSQLPAGTAYLIDAAQFQGHWYYITGSNQSDRISIFKDPLDRIKDPATKKAAPADALRLKGSEKVSFSTNARFIGIQAGEKFAVYDIEVKDSYSYSLSTPPSGPARWMDGHRWLGVQGGSVLILDFDGINQQTLVPSTAAGGFFDRNFERVIIAAPPSPTGTTDLQVVDMLAGSDLPK